MAQTPQGINYQSTVRSPSGQVLVNRTVGVQFTIHDSIPSGPALYRERHVVTTNAFGIFSTVIGTGGNITGSFPNVPWATGGKYLQVEMDLNGGTSYTDIGTSQFVSVPYSLYAAAAATSASAITGARYDTAGVLSITTSIPSTVYTSNGAWLTKGNATLNSATNFVGTIDNTDFILKSHNVEGMRFTTGGAMLATGSAAGVTPASGGGARMMWIPAKAAFRVGSVISTDWDDAYIGSGSIALGKDVMASGAQSVSIGSFNRVTGDKANAFGNNLIAKSMGATVVGSYNDTTGSGSSTTWSANDPLFQIGNGTGSAARSTALSVTKGGDVSAPGLTVTQGFTITPGLMTVNGNFTLNVGNKSMYIITSTVLPALANITMSTTGLKVGQMLYIEVKGSGLNGVRFNDNSGNLVLPLLGLDLLNQDTITLMWDGTSWIAINNSQNH
ncbi:MAG: hypothetical protein JWO03_3997 [Bacteroidetes bacterium]|nr:hypothetical protein [Bacteroidota bacterium]